MNKYFCEDVSYQQTVSDDHGSVAAIFKSSSPESLKNMPSIKNIVSFHFEQLILNYSTLPII